MFRRKKKQQQKEDDFDKKNLSVRLKKAKKKSFNNKKFQINKI